MTNALLGGIFAALFLGVVVLVQIRNVMWRNETRACSYTCWDCNGPVDTRKPHECTGRRETAA